MRERRFRAAGTQGSVPHQMLPHTYHLSQTERIYRLKIMNTQLHKTPFAFNFKIFAVKWGDGAGIEPTSYL